MDRKTNFRGKRTDNGEWVYGDLIHEKYGTCIQYIVLKMPTGIGAPERRPISKRHKACVDPETVGQFTNITADGGNGIYEGDVVRCRGGEYCQGYWEIDTRQVVRDIRYDTSILGDCEHLKVIGNIHDNPSLLETDASNANLL